MQEMGVEICGPEGEDWRVPVSELESRQEELRNRLRDEGFSGALIQTPVDLYYYSACRHRKLDILSIIDQ